jgi:hypothetical protein
MVDHGAAGPDCETAVAERSTRREEGSEMAMRAVTDIL